MALPANIARDLRNALGSFAAANGPSVVPSSAGRALEAWLMMRLARAARATGKWRVSLRLGNAAALPAGADFAFPTSQSGILPSNPAGPGFVLLERILGSPIALELHGSLQWKGRSGATHELDVSMLPQSIATPLRTSGGHPRGLPIAAYECKDKANVATPDEMRQTVARLFDLALVTRPYPSYDCRMFEAATHRRWGRRRTLYREFFAFGAFGVVRAGTFGPGATDLGTHYHVGRHERIYAPGAMANVEARFVQVLERVDSI